MEAKAVALLDLRSLPRSNREPGTHGLDGGIVPVTAGCVAIAFALLLMPSSKRDVVEIAIACALGLGLMALACAWRVAPRLVELGVPIGYLLVIAVLRDGAGGGTSGFGSFFLLPVIYVALFSGRAQLLLILGLMALANVIPIAFVGDPAYPLPSWRGSLVQVGVAAIAGFTIQKLVGQARSRAAVMASQNVRLRQLDQMKDEFLALVSHELRTPLTSISGYLEMLVEDAPDTLTETQGSFLTTIRRNVARLSRLVDDLLFVARLDSTGVELTLHELDLGELLAEAAQAAQPAADAKQITLDLERPGLLRVHGDRARLAQLLDNLVSNAIKFTPAGGHVLVSAATVGAKVRVEISDTGIGIPEDELPQLFSRFFRASTGRKSETPGTGLGLAISQSIAQAHDSLITVNSTPGAGTTFAFDLPTAPTQQQVRAAAKQPALRASAVHDAARAART